VNHRVRDAVVLSSDVTPAMERAARDAALKCRFSPAKQGNAAVEVWVPIRITFTLDG
jgi:TonB family protein